MPILWREAKPFGYVQDSVEGEADRCSGFLCDLVLDGKIEVVGTIRQPFQRALVLCQDGCADVRDVVEVDPAQRQVAQVLGGADLDAADLREVGLVSPAEKA